MVIIHRLVHIRFMLYLILLNTIPLSLLATLFGLHFLGSVRSSLLLRVSDQWRTLAADAELAGSCWAPAASVRHQSAVTHASISAVHPAGYYESTSAVTQQATTRCNAVLIPFTVTYQMLSAVVRNSFCLVHNWCRVNLVIKFILCFWKQRPQGVGWR